MRVTGRLLFIGCTVGLVVGCGGAAPQPTSSVAAEDAALELVRGIQAEIDVTDSALVAARATADFGIEEGLGIVTIRMVEEMGVAIRLTAAEAVLLAESPGLCVVGPFWNPLDAGLSDRCWGTPDLTDVGAGAFPAIGEGQALIPRGSSVTVDAALARGDERCDYAPGEWHLEVSVRPVVNGNVFGPVRLPNLTFTVPTGGDEPLTLLPFDDTRVCSYPAAVFLRQGEPELIPE